MDLLALGDVVGQVLQDHGSLLAMFLCDGPGEGVDLG
jgi:hypothetical protein